MTHRLAAFCAFALLAAPAPALAREIVLTNDDGLTSNVLALYHALEEAGHDVIVAVPCRNQSGQGAALLIGRPLVPLTTPCRADAARAGDPAAGPMTREDVPQGDFFYVDGTPVMALAYGLDVAAQARWGQAPDLVLSGPNEGQNVGAIVISSGTVSNAQFAALRSVPAIALSAGENTASETLDNPLSGQIAQLSLALLRALEAKAGEGPLLPVGLALNVNFPNTLEGAAWRATRIGSYNAYRLGFTDNMAASASPEMQARARERGIALPELPGLTFEANADAPEPGQQLDESVVIRRDIAVSPMQAGYAYGTAAEEFLAWQLADLMTQAEGATQAD